MPNKLWAIKSTWKEKEGTFSTGASEPMKLQIWPCSCTWDALRCKEERMDAQINHLGKIVFFLPRMLYFNIKMYVVKHWKLTTRAQQEARQFTLVMNRNIYTLRFIRRLGSYDYRKVNQESKLTKKRAHLSPSGQKLTLASSMSNPNFLRS